MSLLVHVLKENMKVTPPDMNTLNSHGEKMSLMQHSLTVSRCAVTVTMHVTSAHSTSALPLPSMNDDDVWAFCYCVAFLTQIERPITNLAINPHQHNPPLSVTRLPALNLYSIQSTWYPLLSTASAALHSSFQRSSLLFTPFCVFYDCSSLCRLSAMSLFLWISSGMPCVWLSRQSVCVSDIV
jgi:hypothetical protein